MGVVIGRREALSQGLPDEPVLSYFVGRYASFSKVADSYR